MKSSPASLGDQTARVYDSLLARILQREIPAGVRLVETAIAEELGLSRWPVRHAFARLESDGLVEILPHRGAYVRGISPTTLTDYQEIHTALDELMIRLATASATDEDLERCVALARESVRAAGAGEYVQAIELGIGVRRELMRATGSAALVDLESRTATILRTMAALTPDPRPVADASLALALCVSQRDPVGAQVILQNSVTQSHIVNVSSAVTAIEEAMSSDDLSGLSESLSEWEVDALSSDGPSDQDVPETISGQESNRIAAALREQIILGKRGAGTIVSERGLSSELGATRGSARAAIRSLADEGLVGVSGPRSSPRVRTLADAELLDVFHVARALVVLGHRLACQRQTRSELIELHARIAKVYTVAKSPSHHGGLAAALSVHQHIMQMSGNSLLVQLEELLRPRLYAALYRFGADLRNLRCYSIIFDAFTQRQPDAAAAAVDRWLGRTFDAYAGATAQVKRS